MTEDTDKWRRRTTTTTRYMVGYIFQMFIYGINIWNIWKSFIRYIEDKTAWKPELRVPVCESFVQEGWLSPTERASVSAISLRHILASPGYAPGKSAVNVTWMERGLNAGQKHSSIYPSVFNRLRAIARYWSEIATFPTPLHLTPSLGCSHWNSGKKFGPQKTRIMGLCQAVKTVWW